MKSALTPKKRNCFTTQPKNIAIDQKIALLWPRIVTSDATLAPRPKENNVDGEHDNRG